MSWFLLSPWKQGGTWQVGSGQAGWQAGMRAGKGWLKNKAPC